MSWSTNDGPSLPVLPVTYCTPVPPETGDGKFHSAPAFSTKFKVFGRLTVWKLLSPYAETLLRFAVPPVGNPTVFRVSLCRRGTHPLSAFDQYGATTAPLFR